MLDLAKLATQYTKQIRDFARSGRILRQAQAACKLINDQDDYCPASAHEEVIAYHDLVEAAECVTMALSFQMNGESWATRWAALQTPSRDALKAMSSLKSDGWTCEYLDGIIIAACEVGTRRDGLLLNIIATDTMIASSVYVDKEGSVGSEQDSLFSIKN